MDLVSHEADYPVLHAAVSALLRSERFVVFAGSSRLENNEGGEALRAVLVCQRGNIGAVDLGEHDLFGAVPSGEVVHQLVPLSLELVAPSTVLHVEVDHDELVSPVTLHEFVPVI